MSDRLTCSLGDFSQYQILPTPAHTILTQACLGNLLQLDGCMKNENIKDFSLAQYAARHWVTHAQFENVASNVKEGMETLRVFDPGQPYFASWVGIFNIDLWSSNIPTPLYYSSLCGFSGLVEHLAIKHPKHVNAIGGYYDFPLAAALAKKYIEVAEILLKHGAKVDIRGTRERAPLHHTIKDANAVQFLLDHGADVDPQDAMGKTPLHLLLEWDEDDNVLDLDWRLTHLVS